MSKPPRVRKKLFWNFARRGSLARQAHFLLPFFPFFSLADLAFLMIMVDWAILVLALELGTGSVSSSSSSLCFCGCVPTSSRHLASHARSGKAR